MSKPIIVKTSPVMAGGRSGGTLVEYVEIPRAELDRIRTENERLKKLTHCDRCNKPFEICNDEVAIANIRRMEAELNRLRAENERLEGEISTTMTMRLKAENDRLRAGNDRLEKLNKANSDGWAEAVKLNMMALTPVEGDRLRAEKAELVERCAQIAINPGFIEARDNEWDEGVNYAKEFIAKAIRALAKAANERDRK